MKSIILLIVGLAVAINANPFNQKLGHERIVGGSVAERGQFPYLVALRVQHRMGEVFRLTCGGSILSTSYILTAANCSVHYTVFNLIIAVGGDHINSGTTHWLTKIIIHPQYDPDTKRNDVSLLKTTTPIVFTRYVQPIRISSQHANGGFEATTSGWGLWENGGHPDYLLYIRTQTLDNEECENRWPSFRKLIFDSSLCTVNPGRVAVCTFDSGGPLVLNGTLVGVTSWTAGNCRGGAPDVFARVAHHVDWIEQHTGVKPSS